MCCFDRRERRKARFASKSFEGDGAMRTGSTPLLETASRPFLARLVILLDSRRLCAAPSRPRDDCLQAVDAPILRDNSFFSSSFSGGKKGLSLIETKIRQLTPAFGLYS